MHPEENGAVADRFRKAKMLDHDVVVREPEETGRRSRFCEAKILTLPISEVNFLTKKVGQGVR